jgi:hypothetical protein
MLEMHDVFFFLSIEGVYYLKNKKVDIHTCYNYYTYQCILRETAFFPVKN